MADEALGQVSLQIAVDQAALDAGLAAARRKIEVFRSQAAAALSGIDARTESNLGDIAERIGRGSGGASGGRIGGNVFGRPDPGAFRQFSTEVGRAREELDAASRSGNRFAETLAQIRDIGLVTQQVVQVVTAVTQSLVGVAQASIQAAGEAQRLAAAFQALTGSKEVAEDLRNTLFQLSKTTPFKNEDILETSRRFLAVGVSADKLQGTINRIGALSAQSGQDLGRIGLIYSQIFAKGRLQGEENLQLLEAGIDLTGRLQQVTGLQGETFRKAMETGKIGIAEVNEAIKLATGDMAALVEGGRAVDVAFNNIGDNIQQVFLGFSKAIAPALSAAANVVNEAFDQLFPTLEQIDKLFSPLAKEAERFAKALENNPELVRALATAFESLLQFGINGAVEGVKGLNDQLEQRPDGILQTVVDLELQIRKTFQSAKALLLLLTAPARLGGFFNPDTAKQIVRAVKEFEIGQELKPIEIPTEFAKPKTGPDVPDELDNRGQQSLANLRKQQLATEERINQVYANRSLLLSAQEEIAESITRQGKRQEDLLKARANLESANKALANAEPRSDGKIDPGLIRRQEEATAALAQAQRSVNVELNREEAQRRRREVDIDRLQEVNSIYDDRTRTFDEQRRGVERLTKEYERQDRLLSRVQVYQSALEELARYAAEVDQGITSFDPTIERSLQVNVDAAGAALYEAGLKTGRELREAAAEAGRRLQDAGKAFDRAQDSAFNLLTRQAQEGRRAAALQTIREGVNNPRLGLDPAAVNRAIEDGSFSSLRSVADQVQALSESDRGLQTAIEDAINAQQDLTKATRELAQIIGGGGPRVQPTTTARPLEVQSAPQAGSFNEILRAVEAGAASAAGQIDSAGRDLADATGSASRQLRNALATVGVGNLDDGIRGPQQELTQVQRQLASATEQLATSLQAGTYVTVNVPVGSDVDSNQQVRYA